LSRENNDCRRNNPTSPAPIYFLPNLAQSEKHSEQALKEIDWHSQAKEEDYGIVL
jgi:hypothetical protein